MANHILIITSNHGELDGEPNGTYMPELTHALEALQQHNISYELASPKGGPIPGYGKDADEVTRTMLADPEFAARLENTTPLRDIDPDRYDGVFYPGGYGLLFDLVGNQEASRITASIFERGAPIAAVCHGPAALSSVTLSDGSALIKNRNVTGFTREEEVAMDTLDKIPFVLEERMMENDATYQKKSPWKVFVIRDGLLITGQNPASAKKVGEELAAALKN